MRKLDLVDQIDKLTKQLRDQPDVIQVHRIAAIFARWQWDDSLTPESQMRAYQEYRALVRSDLLRDGNRGFSASSD